MHGVALQILHPDLDCLTCEECREYEIDPETKAVKNFPGSDKPIKRDPRSLCDCETPSGCPVGSYDNPRRLSRKNRRAYHHYLECKALNRFPRDGIVERNAGIIFQVQQTAERIASCKHQKQIQQALQNQNTLLAALVQRPT